MEKEREWGKEGRLKGNMGLGREIGGEYGMRKRGRSLGRGWGRWR